MRLVPPSGILGGACTAEGLKVPSMRDSADIHPRGFIVYSGSFQRLLSGVIALTISSTLTVACGGGGGGESGEADRIGPSSSTGIGDDGGVSVDGVPGKLKISAENLNLDPGGVVEFTVTNTGGATLEWSAASSENWLALSPAEGELAPGRSSTVAISSKNAPDGSPVATVKVQSGSGQSVIAVRVATDHAPAISDPRFVDADTGRRISRICTGDRMQILAEMTSSDGVAGFSLTHVWLTSPNEGGGGGALTMRLDSGATYRSPSMHISAHGNHTFTLKAEDRAGRSRKAQAKISVLPGNECGEINDFTISQ